MSGTDFLAVVVLSVAGIVIGISALHYFISARTSRVRKIFLFSLRTIAVLAMAFACIEPTFSCNRFVTQSGTALVCIDNSQSMQKFDPKRIVVPVIDSLLRNFPADKIHSVYFGDSIRAGMPAAADFMDRRSFFGADQLGQLDRFATILIVSDGQWSNSTLPAPLADRVVYYVQLPHDTPRPFLQIKPQQQQISLSTNGATRVVFGVTGYFSKSSSLTFECREQTRICAKTDRVLPQGNYSDTFSIMIPPSAPGGHYYRCTAATLENSLQTECRFGAAIAPDTLLAALVSPRHSLDTRFVDAAIARTPGWRRTARLDSAHVLFCIGCDVTEVPQQLRKDGFRPVLVFVGTSGSEASLAVPNEDVSLVYTHAGMDLTDRAAYLPPTTLVRFTSPRFTPLETLALAAFTIGKRNDIIPLFYTAEFDKTPAFVFAAMQTWKLDFWPRSSQSNSATSLYDAMLRLTRSFYLKSSFDEFAIFPESVPVIENDSIRLTYVLPARVARQKGDVSIVIKISGRGVVRDTVVSVKKTGGVGVPIVLPALGRGEYAVQAEVRSQDGRLTWQDSIRVVADQSEFFVDGQNTLVLSQYGNAVPLSYTAIKDAMMPGNATLSPRQVKKTFPVNQSWGLFFVIIVCAAGEWFFRRRWGVD